MLVSSYYWLQEEVERATAAAQTHSYMPFWSTFLACKYFAWQNNRCLKEGRERHRKSLWARKETGSKEKRRQQATACTLRSGYEVFPFTISIVRVVVCTPSGTPLRMWPCWNTPVQTCLYNLHRFLRPICTCILNTYVPYHWVMTAYVHELPWLIARAGNALIIWYQLK